MKIFFSILIASFGVLVLPAHATVSLQFTDFGNGLFAAGFTNAAGTSTSGLNWGIIVDTSGNGFAGSSTGYNAYATPTASGYLSFGGAVTDDYFIPASTFNSDPLFNQTSDSSGFGGNSGGGTIYDTTPNNVSVTSGNAASGEKFALVWLGTNSTIAGSTYGMLTFPDFVLPNDGNPGYYANDFSGAYTAHKANLTFTAGTVPEPGVASLSLLGFAGLFLRRRRV